jgi:pyruvate dehydrogenase E2 component (dihydrolipoamide acetyltransferase)
VDVVLPNLGFGMEEGQLVAWLKKPGDSVRKGEIIAEVESDKATVELEAVVDGVLHEIVVPAQTVVPVGTVLARIRAADSPAAQQSAQTEATAISETSASSARSARTTPVAERMAQEHGIDLSSVAGTGPGGRITRDDVQAVIDKGSNGSIKSQPNLRRALAAPAVRKLARDHGIDLGQIRGTGRDGHVTRRDVESALVLKQPPQIAVPTGDRWEVPLSQMRRAIGRIMSQSVQEAPHFYVTAELDLTNALKRLPDGIGINTLLLYVTVQTLKDIPELNATFEDGRLYHYQHVNLAIAVALDKGLISPVLHQADDYSLSGLANQIHQLISRAREGRLKQDELTGGTFTVSNLGMIKQIERFTAIITPPQVGVLAIGAAKERPIVIDGGLHIRNTVHLTLSADHRIVDGMLAARFLETFDNRLQNFTA